MPTGVYVRTEKNRRRMSEAKKNPSEFTRIKMSEAKKGNKYSLGRKHSELTKEKQRQSKLKNPTRYWLGEKRPSGKDCPLWKGGYENKLWHNSQRRIKKFGNGGSHTQNEWIALKNAYNLTCPCCHRLEGEIVLSVDHVVPLSKGGSDSIENIQPLCRSCNSKKRVKIVRYEKPQTIQSKN